MIANYHTHTWRCNHAKGAEEDYVKAALERNFQILGFADHTPYFFPGTYYSGFRMRPEQLKDYCDTVLSLRKKYDGKIQIPLGLELEYYPAYIGELLPFLKDHGIEYLLLGQHFVHNEINAHYSGNVTADRDVLKQYACQVCDAMQTGLFSYLAHPDLINFVGDAKVYQEAMELICHEARNCGIPLEINMLGIWTGRNYPNPLFWELAAEAGCSVVIGCDAHAPDHLRKPDTEKKALALADRFGLQVLETVPLRRI